MELEEFTFTKVERISRFVIAQLNHPDPENHEGYKILVYENVKIKEICKPNPERLSPHFCNNKKFISPVACFKPDEEGWSYAISFCKAMNPPENVQTKPVNSQKMQPPKKEKASKKKKGKKKKK